MQGLLLTSPQQQYPQFVFTFCDITKNPQCFNEGNMTALYELTSGGRIFLFIETQDTKNYATGQISESQSNFILKYFFITPGLYNRAELVMQISNVSQQPDYLHHFTT